MVLDSVKREKTLNVVLKFIKNKELYVESDLLKVYRISEGTF